MDDAFSSSAASSRRTGTASLDNCKGEPGAPAIGAENLHSPRRHAVRCSMRLQKLDDFRSMVIRELTFDDVPFLREMLYAAMFWRPDAPQWPADWALAQPVLAIYHEGWGREGDSGLVAVDEDGSRVGAVWCRLFTEKQHGDGFIDESTPELAIAVAEGCRGRGIGRSLLEAMAEHMRMRGISRLVLSVDDDNPAKALYRRLDYVDYNPGDGKGRMTLEL